VKASRAPAVAALALLAALLGTAVSRAARFGSVMGSRPDLVLIVWDTCRADRVSVNGYPYPTSPRLAGLAAEGVVFRRCFTPSPWTPPAHASLFTGLLPGHHGLREQGGARVHPDCVLLAATLAAAGYETVAASANPLLQACGLLDGFETVLPTTPGSAKDDGDAIVARVDGWLLARRARPGVRRPLFLFVNLMDCHLVLRPRREDVAAARGPEEADRVFSGNPGVRHEDALRHNLGMARLSDGEIAVLSLAYDGGVRAADRSTGGLLDLLGREGLRRRAIIAVVGDHGESLGEHGELEHRWSLHDPVLHVPLVVRWPGRLEGGSVEDAQVRIQDLYRTLLEAAGAAAPSGCGLDSVSLGRAPIEPRDAVAQIQSSSVDAVRRTFPGVPEAALERFRLHHLAIREAAAGPSPRKLVTAFRMLPDGGVRVEREQMYDLRTDPGELRDLLGPGGSPADRAAADALERRYAPLLR
jgi:arylsulfatase A-like enzyme